ncbi:MATE family efflux transporter [Sandarakinorhabdus sp.]|uniref:MATE family efflux transporter n=1 Tax=Sandarakinorhabdus sp. TaxID=1916663 RepID=UPI00286EAC2F|nr:MATE family efflux transporter [Sandarakinorhabdus sp.]
MTSQADGSNPLLNAPLVPLLARLALPNMVGMMAGSLAAIAETFYVGQLGVPALAGMAIVFPFIMLQMMLSGGAMGGGVSAAVARALGAGDAVRANALAAHAFWIAVAAGLVTTAVMLALGPALFAALGGSGSALAQALAYAGIAFLGATGLWLTNILAAVLRGSGNMKVPATTQLATSAAQVLLGGALGLGWGPLPRLGMAGVAAGQVIASAIGAIVLARFLMSGRAAIRLDLRQPLVRAHFTDILRIGAVACISPVQSVLTIVILGRLVAGFGATALAAYGIGTRLEFLLTPLAFSFGVAAVPVVGTAIGAGEFGRARRAAWTGAAMAGTGLGTLGLVLAIWPGLWTRLFTDDPATLAVAAQYFGWAGPGFGLFGAALCLYFASMPAGRVGAMVLAGTLRLAVVIAGGVWLGMHTAPLWTVFALILLATTSFGLASVLAMWRSRWGPAALSTAASRPAMAAQ